MGRKIIASVSGFLIGLVALATLRYLAGVGLPTGAPLAVAVIVAVALFVAPDLDVRKEATKRRAEFTEQLSIFLDLVSLKMAGHAAAAAALPEAAQRGGGWPMMLIRDTLFRARLSGQNEWDALGQLGERIAVPDLRELGALIKLVADDGAQVRTTLIRTRRVHAPGAAGRGGRQRRGTQPVHAAGAHAHRRRIHGLRGLPRIRQHQLLATTTHPEPTKDFTPEEGSTLIELQMVGAWAAERIGRIRAESGDDAGFSTLEWVAIAGVVIVAAIVVATILMNKAKDGANSVNVQ